VPRSGLCGEPVGAFLWTVFHLQDVGLDVVGEEVRRVACVGIVDGAFGAGGVAGLLMRESPDSLEAFVSRQLSRLGRGQPLGLFQDSLRVAETEMRRVADPNRQQISGIIVEQFAPD